VASPQFLIPLPFAKGLQSSVDGVIALCAADAACHKDYPDLGVEFKTVVELLEKSPARFEIRNQSVTLSREMFASKLRSLLYVPQFVSGFPFIIHSAHQGDWTPYAATVMGLASLMEGAWPGAPALPPSARKASRSHGICDPPRDARHLPGRFAGPPLSGILQGLGTGRLAPPRFPFAIRSQVPTLLISGALDPATPPETAKPAAHDLANSRLIIVKQGTHGTGSQCTDGLIADFVKQGSAADSMPRAPTRSISGVPDAGAVRRITYGNVEDGQATGSNAGDRPHLALRAHEGRMDPPSLAGNRILPALVLWVIFGIYWGIAGLNSAPTENSESRLSTYFHQLLLGVAMLLVILPVPGLNGCFCLRTLS